MFERVVLERTVPKPLLLPDHTHSAHRPQRVFAAMAESLDSEAKPWIMVDCLRQAEHPLDQCRRAGSWRTRDSSPGAQAEEMEAWTPRDISAEDPPLQKVEGSSGDISNSFHMGSAGRLQSEGPGTPDMQQSSFFEGQAFIERRPAAERDHSAWTLPDVATFGYPQTQRLANRPAGRCEGLEDLAWCSLRWPMMLSAYVMLMGVLLSRWHLSNPEADDAAPAAIMVEHSAHLLNSTHAATVSSIAGLQGKLLLSKMTIDMDLNAFTAKREAAASIIKAACSLPGQICDSMLSILDAKEIKHHKKSSVPLDKNKGSYYAVWMWVREVGNTDDVEVAYKAASLAYELRDTITYKESVEEKPVIKCEKVTEHHILSSTTSEHCKQVAVEKVVTQMPVFAQSVLSPEEMSQVDAMMELMLSKKVLETAVAGRFGQLAGGTAEALGNGAADEGNVT